MNRFILGGVAAGGDSAPGSADTVENVVTVRPSDFSTAGPTATGAQNSAAIQAAIDFINSVGGGVVLIDDGGTWELDAVGGTPARCITLKANVSVHLAPWVTLKLANDQTTDAAPVSLLYQPASATDVYIGWPDGETAGTLDGNVANQAGWTDGFGQSNGNYLFSAQDGIDGLVLNGLRFQNSFSNSANVGSANTYGNSANVVLRNLKCTNFGEGIQLIGVDDVYYENIEHISSANLAGDYLEFSHCRRGNGFGVISRTDDGNVRATGGSGVDFYACKDFTLDGFFIQGVVYPFQIQCNFSTPANHPDNISISNGTIESCSAWLVQTGGRSQFSNVQFLGQEGGGPQISNAYPTAECSATFTGCRFVLDADGFILSDDATLRMSGCSVHMASGTPTGVLSVNDTPVLDIDGLTVTSDVACPVLSLAAASAPTGKMVNVYAPDVQAANTDVVTVTATGDVTGVTFNGVFGPTAGGGSVARIVGASVVAVSGTVASGTIPKGTAGQRLTFLGTHGPTFTPGARLKLANAETTYTIPTSANNRITFEYNAADDVWVEVARSVTSVATTPVVIYDGSIADPAATSTTVIANLLGALGSLKSISAQSTDNGIAGTAAVNLIEWGTTKGTHTIDVGNQYGGTTSYAPGQVPLVANGKLVLNVVTDGSWNGSGNPLRVRVETWQ